MSRAISIFYQSIKLSLSSKYLYIAPISGIAVTLFLSIAAYRYPGDLAVSPAKYAIGKGIELANFFGCLLSVFVASGSSQSVYELELTKPIPQWKYFLFQTLGEIVFPLGTVVSIMLGIQLYLFSKGEPFYKEIIIVIVLITIAIVAIIGFIKVLSLILDDLPALAFGLTVVLFSTQAFRGALARLYFPWDVLLYMLPDLQTPQLIASLYLHGMDIEWKYLLGPVAYAIISFLVAIVIFERKDL